MYKFLLINQNRFLIELYYIYPNNIFYFRLRSHVRNQAGQRTNTYKH